MIRNFFGITVFLITISIASFGQNVFGRQDIQSWAHNVQQQGPDQARIAWQKTDQALAELVTHAGEETFLTCTYDDLVWAQNVYVALLAKPYSTILNT